MQKFTITIEKNKNGLLISEVIELPGCHTQAKTYNELLKRTKKAIKTYLKIEQPTSKFLGIQQIEI